ncbi:site-specific integrase [Microlunatus speluncae]|uniref:site-specific integrase n=1 Tax=Microlunatus speluncae TaxID=2594267 RepID=UPI001266510D|nr:tyrosine-type recombinase/integrase [Microlunatus speluncae]
MSKQRPHGDGGLYWSEERQRWVAEVTTGYDGRGKRRSVRRYRRTKTDAKEALRELLRDLKNGIKINQPNYTVEQAVTDWLATGIADLDPNTQNKIRTLCAHHVIPEHPDPACHWVGAIKLRDLSVTDVEKWLKGRAAVLARSVLAMVRSYLSRAVRRAMVEDRVHRNVVELAVTPTGQDGRRSKSLTPQQIDEVLDHTKEDRMFCYIVLSLLTGARTEELRSLRWDHVYLTPTTVGQVEVPPYMAVWHSVRRNGDTKTPRSRRTLALPNLCIGALRAERATQAAERLKAGPDWQDTGLVFTTLVGTAMDAANTRRNFRRALGGVPSVDPSEWTPRELRHSFVSMLSDMGLEVDKIAMLVGHAGGSRVTEVVYRHQLRPVVQTGALAFNDRFKIAKE